MEVHAHSHTERKNGQKFEASVYLEQNKNFMLPIKETATTLIALLKKEYHLK